MRQSVVQRKPLLATNSNTPEKELLAFKSLSQKILKCPMNTYDGIRFFGNNSVLKEIV